MEIKAILFDLDNTLIDLFKLKQMAIEASVAAMQDAGLDFSREKIIGVIDKVYKQRGIEYQKVFDDVLKELLKEVDYKILAAGISAYRKLKSAYLDPYPGVVPTLTHLKEKGYKIGIISDAPKLQMWTRLCDAKIHHFFDVVVSSEDTEQKPSALPFKKALEVLKLKPEEVLMVGDWMERDIVGAKRVGMKTALALYGEAGDNIVGIGENREEKTTIQPDFKIKNFSEILNIV